MNITSRSIKISGAFEIAEDLKIGNDYPINLQGGITARTERPDEQGGIEVEYRYKPLLGAILGDSGASKMTHKGSKSAKLRAMIMYGWGEDETGYDNVMNCLLANGDLLKEFYEKHRT